MILYVYSKCSTCQKALSFLEEKKFAFIRKEITQTPPSIADLKSMLKFMNGNMKKLFNSSGQLYREMNLSEELKTMPEDDALTLLSQHGMLVKRPFLLADHFGLTGFNEINWAQKLQQQ
ncbi:MAG: Spx/MgsR family RNA polymerase-binding regulatory protein [Parachlamydiaceae bacterium]|nr:Spx/MgsR family RNA polymerase-binding regulatory protein [Parachlamydiaceae bacterium]